MDAAKGTRRGSEMAGDRFDESSATDADADADADGAAAAGSEAAVPGDGAGVGPASAVWHGIDHVQIAIPAGGEDTARRFWIDRLGFAEVPKPPVMARRGGAWFVAGATQVHVGADTDFVAARKAHPALLVSDLVGLVERAGLDATWSDEIPGSVRCHVLDPFGNRIELIEAAPGQGADP